MKRKIYDKLLEWKKKHKGNTALLIEGARRIGKSYIVEEFAPRTRNMRLTFWIFPIEVKSGQRHTLNSLRKCIVKYSSRLSTPYVLHDKDVKTEDGIVYLPLL